MNDQQREVLKWLRSIVAVGVTSISLFFALGVVVSVAEGRVEVTFLAAALSIFLAAGVSVYGWRSGSTRFSFGALAIVAVAGAVDALAS